jgi:hypothetical protein
MFVIQQLLEWQYNYVSLMSWAELAIYLKRLTCIIVIDNYRIYWI